MIVMIVVTAIGNVIGAVTAILEMIAMTRTATAIASEKRTGIAADATATRRATTKTDIESAKETGNEPR
jgi:hypothetical protein